MENLEESPRGTCPLQDILKHQVPLFCSLFSFNCVLIDKSIKSELHPQHCVSVLDTTMDCVGLSIVCLSLFLISVE
jgi:hypothetical protein